MLLQTPIFLVFLLTVSVIYWLLPSGVARKVWLTIGSYVFYALFDLRFAGVLIGLTLFTYWLGERIGPRESNKKLVWLGIAVNLIVLGYFKYTNFFLDSLSSLGLFIGENGLSSALSIILPIGISFYTFQSISYLVEIHRGKLDPGNSFLDIALYLAFFPKLIAGPIIRPTSFLAQINDLEQSLSKDEIASSVNLILLGLFKKIIIADGLASVSAVAFQATALPDANGFPSPLFIQGFYLYSIQIYADFSGYTDIAMGAAHLLSIKLPQNFKQPYFASTVTEFWNRWHMSLTQWFREYLFFPISRSALKLTKRKASLAVQILSNLITMTLIGLWHGAAWTFVLWGVLHGLLISTERLLGLKNNKKIVGFLQRIVTFHLVGIGWILFRSDSIATAQRFLASMLQFQQMDWLPYYLPSVLLPALLILLIDLFIQDPLPQIHVHLQRWLPSIRIAATIVIISLIVLNVMRDADPRPFIYGQF